MISAHVTRNALFISSILYLRRAEIQRKLGNKHAARASVLLHIRRREQARALAKQEKKP